jgi:hypothetical protein
MGHGDMQRNDIHRSHSIALKKKIGEGKNSLYKKDKRFFKLFEESTSEGSRAAALEMKQLAKRKTKQGHVEILHVHNKRLGIDYLALLITLVAKNQVIVVFRQPALVGVPGRCVSRARQLDRTCLD